MKNMILLSLLSATTLAHASGKVEFFAVGRPSFIKIHGVGKEPTAKVTIKDAKADGTFEFDLTTLDTANGIRNDHMNETLDTKTYPHAKLEIKDLALKTPKTLAPVENADFTGNLTLHNETKPVTGKYSINKDGDATATFTIKMSDFKIQPPNHLGITVKDEVDVAVSVDKLKGTM